MSKKFIYVDSAGLYDESLGAYEESDHIDSSAGAADAGKPIVLNSDGKVDYSMIPFEQRDWKESVRVASTANVPLSGGATLSVDGVALANDDRVLLKDQTTGSENGIYVVSGIGSAYALTRSSDADSDAEVTAGLTTVVEEGTDNADRMYMLITNNPIVVDTTALVFQVVPFNTFSGGDGIAISATNVISVDLLDADSGLYFAGGGTDELAIEWATDFTIDAADDLAFKASDLASTANGEGASIVGMEDASGYYAGSSVEDLANELEAQIGGDTSSTFDFTEENVLADNDSIYPALNKLDLKWGDLASTANGEGASLVGVEDAAGYFVGDDVEEVLAELYTLIEQNGVDYTVGAGGVTKGDLVYISSADTVLPYATLTNSHRGIGLALTTESAAATVKVLANDTILAGVLVGATAGTPYYWDGSALISTIPAGAGTHVWQAGVAKNATDLHVEVRFVKKNA